MTTASDQHGAMHDRESETRTAFAQNARDEDLYRGLIAYLFERSPFYREKLTQAGFADPAAVGGLASIAGLPYTAKDEIRREQAAYPPLGRHLAAPLDAVRRIYSTSGTTGAPCYIALSERDLAAWIAIASRTNYTLGLRPGSRVVTTYNAGPFVAGAAHDGLSNVGVTLIPVGTGNTRGLVKAFEILGADVLFCTPSYALHLIEWCRTNSIVPRSLGIRRIGVAGEPGGGDPVIRAKIQDAFGCRLNEAMGIGDVSISLWAECDDQGGMHFSGRDYAYFELIDPERAMPLPIEDGARGELVYTTLTREAQPLLRFRSRDHVVVNLQPCACGRTTPRVRCIGRTDDMLIVRGVNLYPTAVRAIIGQFAPRVSETIRIFPRRPGVRQDVPPTIVVELGTAPDAVDGLASEIAAAVRAALIVSTDVELVAAGTLSRSQYKTSLVDYSRAT